MTVKEALNYTADRLTSVSDEAGSEAKLIVSFVANTEPNRLIFTEKEVEKESLDKIIDERLKRRPLQYILGKCYFYNGEFLVGEGVLIPRQDTEHLVETGLELLKDRSKISVCDLCSGSGCIAISVAKERPDLKVTAVEKYSEAYSFLIKNIKHNKTENVFPVLADVLEEPKDKYDLILCNPPYIPLTDEKILSSEVKKEPDTALFGGEDGLYFYREITRLWKHSLKKQGVLAFEVGIGEAEKVSKILKNEGFLEITVKKDLSGIERVVFGTANNI